MLDFEELKKETREKLADIDCQISDLKSRRIHVLKDLRCSIVDRIWCGLPPHVGLMSYREIASEMPNLFTEKGHLHDLVWSTQTERWNRYRYVDLIEHFTLGLFTAKGEMRYISPWCYPDNFVPTDLEPIDQIGYYWNNIGPKHLMIELATYLIENNVGYLYYDW